VTHPLRTYLVKHALTEAAFAEKVGAQGSETTASYISQIIIGYRKPGGALAVAISDATNGHVSVDDLLRFEKAPKRRKRAA
jgi:transcriptional regulator with XRE-family HTH domain